VLVYNSADTEFDSTYPSNIVVYHTGDILWIPPGILRTSCKIDIRWFVNSSFTFRMCRFPFDDQSCHIKFGSWTYHGFALDLRPESADGADQSEYMTNGEWLLLSTPVTRLRMFTFVLTFYIVDT
jgi:nicotinic acetylcholine receptor